MADIFDDGVIISDLLEIKHLQKEINGNIGKKCIICNCSIKDKDIYDVKCKNIKNKFTPAYFGYFCNDCMRRIFKIEDEKKLSFKEYYNYFDKEEDFV